MKYRVAIFALVFGPIAAAGMVQDLQNHHSATFNAGLTMFWIIYSIAIVLPAWIDNAAKKH